MADQEQSPEQPVQQQEQPQVDEQPAAQEQPAEQQQPEAAEQPVEQPPLTEAVDQQEQQMDQQADIPHQDMDPNDQVSNPRFKYRNNSANVVDATGHAVELRAAAAHGPTTVGL